MDSDSKRPNDSADQVSAMATPGDETLDVVRRLITETGTPPEEVAPPAPEPVQAEPVIEPPVFVPLTRPVATTAMSALERDPVDAPEPEPEAAFGPPTEPGRLKRLLDRARRDLVVFLKQPDAPRRLALALIVAVAIVRPGFMFGLALVVFAIAAITWFTLGPDRSSELIAAWHARLALRDPTKAEEIRQRAARVSKAVTSAVERLPARWSAGFYLPDFEPTPEMPEKMNDDPFNRIAAERRALDAEGARS